MSLSELRSVGLMAGLMLLGALTACGGERASVELSQLRVEEIGARRAVVRFETSLPTSCEVLYGLMPDALENSATDPNMDPGQLSLSHEVPLEDLSPETKYYYRARVQDREGSVYFSETSDFFTEEDSGTELGENLALLSGAAHVVGVSSNWAGGDNDSGFGANKAFDGQMATEWSSNGDGDGAWVELDLGGERTLSRLGFRSRQMTDGSSIIQRLELSLDDGSVTLGPFATPDPAVRYEFSFEPISVTTIRLVVLESTGGNTGAKEIELYE